MRGSEELYSKMVEEVEDYAIILLDIDGTIINWNKGAEKIKGYSKEEIIGENFKIFYTKTDQEKKIPEKLIQKAITEGKANDESWRCRKDGTRFWGNITITSLHDDENNIIGFSKVTRDLTERHKAEKEILELNQALEEKVKQRTTQLEVANKELESFTYSVSHDLRAPLRAIHNYTNIFLEDYSKNLEPDARHIIESVLHNTELMNKLINDLLAFAILGKKALHVQEINMQSLVEKIRDEYYPRRDTENIHFNIQPLPSALGDYTLLKQVWINLISNAIKYSKHNSVTEIDIGAEKKTDKIIYFIKDNGVGFNMEYHDKIFDVFQRLHSQNEFEGTGVGLSFVQKILKYHGGEIWADAKVGEGATFYFTLSDNLPDS